MVQVRALHYRKHQAVRGGLDDEDMLRHGLLLDPPSLRAERRLHAIRPEYVPVASARPAVPAIASHARGGKGGRPASVCTDVCRRRSSTGIRDYARHCGAGCLAGCAAEDYAKTMDRQRTRRRAAPCRRYAAVLAETARLGSTTSPQPSKGQGQGFRSVGVRRPTLAQCWPTSEQSLPHAFPLCSGLCAGAAISAARARGLPPCWQACRISGQPVSRPRRSAALRACDFAAPGGNSPAVRHQGTLAPRRATPP